VYGLGCREPAAEVVVEEEEEELDDSEIEYDSDGGKLSRAQRTVCPPSIRNTQ